MSSVNFVNLKEGLWGITASGILVGPFKITGSAFIATGETLKQSDCNGGRDHLDQVWLHTGAVSNRLSGEERDHIVTTLTKDGMRFIYEAGEPIKSGRAYTLAGRDSGLTVAVVSPPSVPPVKHPIKLIEAVNIAHASYGRVAVETSDMKAGRVLISVGRTWYSADDLQEAIATLQQIEAAIRENHPKAKEV